MNLVGEDRTQQVTPTPDVWGVWVYPGPCCCYHVEEMCAFTLCLVKRWQRKPCRTGGWLPLSDPCSRPAWTLLNPFFCLYTGPVFFFKEGTWWLGLWGGKGQWGSWERRKIAVMGGGGCTHQDELDLLIACLCISSFSWTINLLRKTWKALIYFIMACGFNMGKRV